MCLATGCGVFITLSVLCFVVTVGVDLVAFCLSDSIVTGGRDLSATVATGKAGSLTLPM